MCVITDLMEDLRSARSRNVLMIDLIDGYASIYFIITFYTVTACFMQLYTCVLYLTLGKIRIKKSVCNVQTGKVGQKKKVTKRIHILNKKEKFVLCPKKISLIRTGALVEK